jgi:hypothetical protein
MIEGLNDRMIDWNTHELITELLVTTPNNGGETEILKYP